MPYLIKILTRVTSCAFAIAAAKAVAYAIAIASTLISGCKRRLLLI